VSGSNVGRGCASIGNIRLAGDRLCDSKAVKHNWVLEPKTDINEEIMTLMTLMIR